MEYVFRLGNIELISYPSILSNIHQVNAIFKMFEIHNSNNIYWENPSAKLFIILTSSNVIENADTKVIIKKIFGIDNNATYHLKPYRYSFVI